MADGEEIADGINRIATFAPDPGMLHLR